MTPLPLGRAHTCMAWQENLEGSRSALCRSQQMPPSKWEQPPEEIHVQALLSARELRHTPTGAPNAAETPAAAPADTKSLFSVSLRKYSKI